MKRKLKLQSKFITYNIIALLIIILYTLVSVAQKGFSIKNNKAFIVFVIIFIIHFTIYKLDYFNKLIIYLVVKTSLFFIASYMVFDQVQAMRFFYVFYAILLLVELMTVVSFENDKYKIYLGIFGGVIIFISSCNKTEVTSDLWELFVSLVIIITALYSLYNIYIDIKNDELSKLKMQTSLFEEATRTNEELRVSQNKFKLIHEKMAKQKNELEVANKELNRLTSEIFTQNELLRYISSVLDIKELLDMVADAIMGTIGVDTCSLVLFDERNEEYLYSMKSNHPGDYLMTLKSDVEAGFLQEFFETDKIHLNNNIRQKDYPFISNRPVGSIAIIPLLRDNLTYGLILAEHSNVNMFTENNSQFFTGIATQITIAINNANIYALMEEMAIKDGLTGIYNRKYLQDHIEELILNAKNNNQPLSIALLDIDHFKTVNDQYGHLFGDEAIKMAAFMTQRRAVKNNGYAIRYGGEEFVLVLPNTDLETAYKIVNKLHGDIKNEVLLYNDKEVYIDVSLGISSYPQVASHGAELLLRADNAMYYSKEHGRGKITLDNKNLEKVI